MRQCFKSRISREAGARATERVTCFSVGEFGEPRQLLTALGAFGDARQSSLRVRERSVELSQRYPCTFVVFDQ